MSDKNMQAQLISVPDLPKEYYDELKLFIDQLEEKEGNLIKVLHKAQKIFGYLPREVQLFIAKELDLSGAEVFGVVSFYSYFNTRPEGRHRLSLCMGTACFVRGADKVNQKIQDILNIKVGETTKDFHFTLKNIRCIGACGLAPVLMVDDKVYGNVTEDDVERILNEYME
ncbi:MAG: NAD(P)H-dependent oxidoreductase subunit E [Tissierellales bacterium]|jgi:NADH-quinone oxidoreductase subunit E/NADP-reducing hydrogenase subunit HndA|nr:NAD(P)H-dependent oxidoreductase subunit E [Tissierellales bacterium]